jgi:hypothetical protein
MSHVSLVYGDCELSLSISAAAAAAGKVKREERKLKTSILIVICGAFFRCLSEPAHGETANQGWLPGCNYVSLCGEREG